MQSCEVKRKKCGSCRVNLLETEYKTKRNGSLTSLCVRCLDNVKRWRDRKREERLSDTSSEVSSVQTTEKKCQACKRILSINNFSRKLDGKICACCISCCSRMKKYKEEKYRYEHNSEKNKCKQCNDPIDITINQMIRTSKQSDKLHKRYDADHFIDRCFLESLIEDLGDKCHYCRTQLQYIEYADDLATIERLDNKVGHIKSNCVIACLSCNKSHQD